MIDRFSLVAIRIIALYEAVLFIDTLPAGFSALVHAYSNSFSLVLPILIIGIHGVMAFALWIAAVPISKKIVSEAISEPVIYKDGGFDYMSRALFAATGFLILCNIARPLGKILPEFFMAHSGSLATNVFEGHSYDCIEMVVYLSLGLVLITAPKGLWNLIQSVREA